MHPAAAEYTVSRTYLDWLLELPWSLHTDDNLDILQAQQVLDEDHYDLEKVKKRIIEYLAVRQLKKDMKGPILCFVGPPGVGKTSLGRSIARALGENLSGFRWAAFMTRRRFAVTGAHISGPYPAASSRALKKLNPIIPCLCWMKWINWGRFSRRPVFSFIRSARSGTKFFVFRSLPGSRLRSVESDVYCHRQYSANYSSGASGSDGNFGAARLY